MKILIVGDGFADIHEDAFAKAFGELGADVTTFFWARYFKHYPVAERFGIPNNILESIYYRFQNKFRRGPVLSRINRDLLALCQKQAPDLIFIVRGTHVFPEVILTIQKTGTKIFCYNNDDPFGRKYPAYFWRYFIKGLPYCDHIFAYRAKNVEDYHAAGFKNVSLLRSYYIKQKNFPIEKIGTNPYLSDVVFVGHFEDDGRDVSVKAISESNIRFKLYGPEWQRSRCRGFLEKKLGKIKPLYGDYNLALNNTKIALSFLSKLNHDTYTRRSFEIPAAKTFMLSEYSRDLDGMFKEGVEAEYFRSKEEMLDKIRFYLKNEEMRKKIAEAGYQRLLRDGHEIKDRCREILKVFAQQAPPTPGSALAGFGKKDNERHSDG